MDLERFDAQFAEDEEERNDRLRRKRIARATDAKRCDRCRYWSEMCAQSIGGDPMEALCLAETGRHHGKMTRGNETCDQWASNHHGSIDSPPNYGEVARARYAADASLPRKEGE